MSAAHPNFKDAIDAITECSSGLSQQERAAAYANDQLLEIIAFVPAADRLATIRQPAGAALLCARLAGTADVRSSWLVAALDLGAVVAPVVEPPLLALRRHCAAAGMPVDDHLIRILKGRFEKLVLLDHCHSATDFTDFYQQHVLGLVGTSTKQRVVAVDTERNIVMGGPFLAAHSASADFCYAYEDGKPYLLKMAKLPGGAAALQHEADVIARVSACLKPQIEQAAQAAKQALTAEQLRQALQQELMKRGLVPVELVDLIDPRLKQPSPSAAPGAAGSPSLRISALQMPVFVCTLESCPSGVRMAELYANAAAAVHTAMSVLHAAGLVHCDIKPSNIFVDSAGRCLLGDYDAVEQMNAQVRRCTPEFLPPNMAVRFPRRTPTGFALLASGVEPLQATPAVDYAMLAYTLLAGLGQVLAPQQSLKQFIQQSTEMIEQDEAKATSRAHLNLIHSQLKIMQQLSDCDSKINPQ